MVFTSQKLKGLFSENYVDKFEKSFPEILECLTGKIDNDKFRVNELLSIYKETTCVVEEERASIEQEKTDAGWKKQAFEQEKLDTERKMCAKKLYDEIIVIAENLSSSAKVKMTDVSDHLLLDLKKNVFQFTLDLREILGKHNFFFQAGSVLR